MLLFQTKLNNQCKTLSLQHQSMLYTLFTKSESYHTINYRFSQTLKVKDDKVRQYIHLQI